MALNIQHEIERTKREIKFRQNYLVLLANLQGIQKHVDRSTRPAKVKAAPKQAKAKKQPEAKPKRKLTAAGRARIRAAVKRRWAKVKAAPKQAKAKKQPEAKPKRKLTAAGRARIRAAVKRRWAKVHAEQKKAAK